MSLNRTTIDWPNLKFTLNPVIIVGAMTGAGAIPPKQEWIESIIHPNIHYKKNILKYMEQS